MVRGELSATIARGEPNGTAPLDAYANLPEERLPDRLSETELSAAIDQSVAIAINPSQAILDLATADGWTAVYDPTNAATLTLDGANVASIADGLGNLPDLAQATTANQPAHLPARSDASTAWTEPAQSSTSAPQPSGPRSRSPTPS